MGQVRWVGWTMAIATALVVAGGQRARAQDQNPGDASPADITSHLPASDKPAAIVVYPKVVVDDSAGVDTVIRLTNTDRVNPVNVHCFYLDANSHCSGGSNEGGICSTATDCPLGFCIPSWNETDFDIVLTGGQPIQWEASEGISQEDLIGTGFCKFNPFFKCAVDADCRPFPGGPAPSPSNPTGACTQNNIGTRVPPVPESPFIGELKCIETDANHNPIALNDLKGEGLIETVTDLADTADADFDVASYNAIGLVATGNPITGNPLTLGGDPDTAEYNGCPNFLILNHFFDLAEDPVPGTDDEITTDITLVPCSEDLQHQIPGEAVVQYLVFNEFEQRISFSNSVRCFEEIQLCNIQTSQCSRSIWSVGVAGSLTGQTRLNPIGVSTTNPPGIASGLVGIAIEKHAGPSFTRTAAFALDMSGLRVNPDGSSAVDTITLP